MNSSLETSCCLLRCTWGAGRENTFPYNSFTESRVTHFGQSGTRSGVKGDRYPRQEVKRIHITCQGSLLI